MAELSRRRIRELERIHILRTLVRFGPLEAASVADRANQECDHDEFDGLPQVSRRGMGAKLNAMSLNGLVRCVHDTREGGNYWEVTEKGREVAETDPYTLGGPRVVDPDEAGIEAARRLAGWYLGDRGWADKIVGAYLNPRAAHRELDRVIAERRAGVDRG